MKIRIKETLNVLNDRLAPWLNWKMGLQPIPVKPITTKNQPLINR